jgi:hypothetical protein
MRAAGADPPCGQSQLGPFCNVGSHGNCTSASLGGRQKKPPCEHGGRRENEHGPHLPIPVGYRHSM